MLITGFFMGVFLATFQITAESLFINRLGDQLHKAFVIAGLLGIVGTGVFSFFQNYIRYSILTVCGGIVILLLTVSFYVLLHRVDTTYQDEIIFLMFCMTGPFMAVLLLIYWGTFGRLFNFRQSKRIIGWIDTGQLVAAILASFIIPLTSTIIPETSDYLLVCCGSVLMVCVFLAMISSQFSLAKNNPAEIEKEVRQETKLTRLFKDKYILVLSVLILISTATFMLNQFLFQQMLSEQYAEQRDLTNFNAFFTGAVFGLSLIMQTFVNNKIIGNYGLRISLILLPIVTGIFAFGALSAGSVFGYERSIAPTGFVYFFLFVALCRLFNWSFKDSLENPVLKLFLIPMDGRIRFNVQAKVEGLVTEAARFVSGLLILGLGFLPFIKSIHIPMVLLALGVVYVLVINNLYKGYRSKIQQRLEASESEQEKLEFGFSRIVERLKGMLVMPAAQQAIFSFKLLEKINSAQLHNWINGLIKNDDEGIRNYAQERLNELKGLSVSDRYVIKMDHPQEGVSKNVLSKEDLQLIIDNDGDITKARIHRLTRSTNPDDRQYAAELLLHTSQDECISYLIELLHDPEVKVKSTAIKTASKKFNTEVINALVANFNNPVYSNQALSAVVQIGGKALVSLESAFYSSGQHTQTLLRIVQAYGRIGGRRAQDLLWNKIDFPNKVVVSQVLLSLSECGFKAGVSQVTRIKYAIESDIADIRWNLSAIQEIGEGGISDEIIKSLRWEIQNDIEHIYMLLAMLYDTRSIQLVKENIDSGTTEGITYAIELLDLFLSEQLKQRVIPVLDELPDNERISRLDVFYPRTKLDQTLVLKFLINRDFTQSNRWTKACVLYQIGIRQIEAFRLDLIAQLFNQDRLIYEVAAWALYRIDPELYKEHVKRLDEFKRRALDEVILHGRKMSQFEKVIFYLQNQFFEGVPGIVLSYLGDISLEESLAPEELLTLDEQTNNNFYFLVKGSVRYYRNGEFMEAYGEGQFLGEMLASDNTRNANRIQAIEPARLLKINKDQFYELLSDNVKLVDQVLACI